MSTRSLAPEPVRTQPVRQSTPIPPAREGVTERVRDAEAATRTAVAPLHLAELDVHGSHPLILDDDSARGLVTHWLLRELAPLLGLDPSKIKIHVDAEAESRNNARHTTGLVENGTIYIHPRGFDPATQSGRLLLAHEATHVAQRQIAAPGALHMERAHDAAEHEAAGIARAFAERGNVMQPRSSLPLLLTAAAEDAPPLDASVPVSRAREIAEIHRLLSGLWISDGDVFKVMLILDTMAFAVARQVVVLLGNDSEDRYHLADNINSPHLGPHTASVVATYAALPKGELQRAIDLDVFGKGSWGDMTSEVRQAAREVIALLTASQQQQLLKSENRIDIKRLTSGAAVLPDSPEERKASEEKVRQKEAKLARGRVQIAAIEKDSAKSNEANELLDKVRTALKPPVGDEGNPSVWQRALNAMQLLAPSTGTPMFSFVAEKLDEEGLVDTIIETLPDDYFLQDKPQTNTVLELVQARLPSKNIEMVIGLLSYGSFDWAVRDYEAQFAYRVLLAMPLADQYHFRHIEGGKYFLRLASNLPKAITKEKGYHEIEVHKTSKEELKKIAGKLRPDQKGLVDEDEGLYDAGKLYAEKRASAGTAIEHLLQQAKEAHDNGWKKADAEKLFKDLAAVGGASFSGKDEDKHFNAKDQLLTETVVHDLDRAGYIEELFKALNNDFLFSEDYRLSTVRIMMARDPVRAAAHARDLVSYGLLDWMVTDREAYLAYLIVKALPEDERADLIKNDAWAWKRIQNEMSQEMRQSPDLNLYVGDKEGTDRASVLGKLAEKSAWTEETAVALDGLLRMAIAMSEHRFAFERSKEFEAFGKDKPALNALVKKYKLAENAKQEWKAEILKGTKWYEEGVFATLRTLWKGLVFLWDNDLLLVTRSLGSINLDLNEAQDVMGGNLMGAHVGDPGGARDEHGQRNPDANKLTLLADVGAHAVTVILPDLILDSVNFQSPGGTIEAGSVRLRDLKIYATYDTGEMDEPTAAQIYIGGFEMNDVLLAMSEKMVTVSRFLLSTLHLGAGTKDTTTRSKSKPRGGYYFPFPFLTTIGTAIYYLFKFKGWGTDTPAQEMKHGMEQVRALDITFASLEVQGLTTSGGQTVGNLKVADFALHIGMNKTTVLRAQIASLGKQIKRKKALHDDAGAKALEDRQIQANIDLKNLEGDEKWLIGAQHRILHEKLSPEESKQLQDKIDALKFEAEGAQFLDIGSIDATGVSGGVTVKSPIHLEGLHGEGTTKDMANSLGLGIVTDATLVRQMAEGSKGAPTPFSDRANEFRLDIDKFGAEGVSIGGGQIRSVDEIHGKMRELFKDKDKPEFAGMYQELVSLLPEAELYEEYLQIGVSALDPTQRADFQRLRTVLARDPSIVFGSIDLVRAHLDVYGATGGIGIGADEATLKNISMPEKGLVIDEVKGLDIKANAAAANGLAGWLDWKKNLTGGGIHAGVLEVSGARSRSKGVLFEKATLKNGDANLWGRGNVATARFDFLSIEGLGLEPRLNLMQRRLAALEQNRKPAPQERKERDRLREDVPALQGLLDEHVLAVAAVDKAKSAAERKKPSELLAHLDGLIEAMLARYGTARLQLDDFGVKATGAGDVLGDVLDGGFDMQKTLKRGGVTVEGTGDGHQVLGHASLSYKSPGPDDSRVGRTDAEIGPVKLNATVTEDDKNNITVDVTQLDLAEIALSEMMLTGLDKLEGGSKIWSSGRSVFSGIRFAGSLVFAPVGNPEGDYRLAHIGITTFDIDNIVARGFGYANSALKVEVRANTAMVHGIHAGGMGIDLPAEKDADAVIVGKARIESISNADLAATLPGGMELSHGLLNARDLSIGFLEGGGKTLSTADLSLTAAELRGPDGWAHFSLEHLSGAITMDKNGYRLQNIKLQKLTVPKLDWKAGATGRITAEDSVELVGLSVDGRIDMKEVDAPAKKGEITAPGAKPKKGSKLVGVHIDTFRLDSIIAKHLTYKDGDTVIDVGLPVPSDKDVPKFMEKFRPFYIENFAIQGLDWTKEAGIKSGDIHVEKYGAAVVYKDLKEHLVTGGGLTGAGMHATFTGPNTGTATLGKIDEINGFLKNKDFATSFVTGNIMESFTFGEDFVEMKGLTVDNVVLDKTEYGGAPQKITLGSGKVKKVAIDTVRVGYKKNDKDETRITNVKVGEVKFSEVSAREFSYTGASEEKVDGEKVAKTKKIEAESAWIERLSLVNIDYDAAKALTTLGIRLDDDSAKRSDTTKSSAFRVSGLTGEFVNKFSDGSTVARFAAYLHGGALSSGTISLHTIKQNDGSNQSRTEVSGTFSLSSLGLTSITGSYTDKQGKETTLGGLNGKGASLEFEGITPTLEADGTLRVPNMSAHARNFKIVSGTTSVSIPMLNIENIALGMRGVGTDEGIHDFGVRLGELSVNGLVIELEKTKHKRTKEEADKELADPLGHFFAQPLDSINGTLVLVFPTGVEKKVAIKKGKLDVLGRHDDIRKTVEDSINKRPKAWDSKEKDPEKDEWYDYLKVRTEPDGLQLGEGSIGITPPTKKGSAPTDIYLDLENGAAGRNVIHIPQSDLGSNLGVNIPNLHGRKIVFPDGQTGNADFNLSISVRGLATLKMEITITANSGKIENIEYGDLTVLPEQKKSDAPKGGGTR